MKPNHFAALGLGALASLALAILSYSSYVPWTEPAQFPKLLPNIGEYADKVTTIGISQGSKSVTLELKDKTWVLKERDGYPANADKVRGLLLALSDAGLAEDKTQKPDRYELLQVEDPQQKGAASNLLKLSDASNAILAELIVGRVRANAFGGGQGGTYVRRPGEAQAWIVNAEIDASSDIKSWFKTRIFETQVDRIRKVTIEIPGEPALVIDWDAATKQHVLKDVPAGKQVKFVNSVPDMIDSLANIDMEDVRKSPDTPSGSNVSTLKVESEGGLVVNYVIRKTPEGDWLSLSAAGEGEHKKFADLFTAGAKGWEFKLAPTKAEEFLKKRADLIDDIVVPEPGPGAQPAPATPPPPAPAP